MIRRSARRTGEQLSASRSFMKSPELSSRAPRSTWRTTPCDSSTTKLPPKCQSATLCSWLVPSRLPSNPRNGKRSGGSTTFTMRTQGRKSTWKGSTSQTEACSPTSQSNIWTTRKWGRCTSRIQRSTEGTTRRFSMDSDWIHWLRKLQRKKLNSRQLGKNLKKKLMWPVLKN